MFDVKIGEKFQIQCYKHDGQIHRFWDEAVVLNKTDEYIVFGNNKTKVIESQGITWKTKEPAVMYFFYNKWFNVISQLKKDGVYYYCNIASPFIIEDGTIKYIDYDLDLRIFPTGEFKILDSFEYEYHKKLMNYSDKLDTVIKNSLDELIKSYKNKYLVFDNKLNKSYSDLYFQLKK